jgi:hypothetical protein
MCRLLVLGLLHQNIENVTILINSTPEISTLTSNGHNKNLIKIPGIAKPSSMLFYLSGVG